MFALLLLSIIPYEATIDDRCDVLEKSHVYDEAGDLRMIQWIFWRWNPIDRQYQVRDWRLVKERDTLIGTTLHIPDDHGHWRRIRAVSVRISHDQFDPELVDREFTPECYRQKLTPPCPAARQAGKAGRSPVEAGR